MTVLVFLESLNGCGSRKRSMQGVMIFARAASIFRNSKTPRVHFLVLVCFRKRVGRTSACALGLFPCRLVLETPQARQEPHPHPSPLSSAIQFAAAHAQIARGLSRTAPSPHQKKNPASYLSVGGQTLDEVKEPSRPARCGRCAGCIPLTRIVRRVRSHAF